MNTVLELSALTKDYATHRAVDQVSLAIESGEFFSLVGPSGCGKTTTLRMIAGFETPSAGEILLDGRAVTAVPPYRRDVSTVFQNYALFPHLTVEKNVAFGLERRPELTKSDIAERVAAALRLVELTGKEKRLPAQISGGERQRVALARSIVLRPKVLLLDEPLSALDPKLRKQMRRELKALQREVGIAFLFVTHDQEEALSLSDRMGVMNGGKLLQIGVPRELYGRPRSRFVAEFLGDVNWIDQTAIRPEATRISRNAPDSGLPSIRGVVQGTTFLGNCVHVHTRLNNGSVCIAELGNDLAGEPRSFEPGEGVHVWWTAADELSLPAAPE